MDMITRCPACETSFRITEAQLNTAKGAVRCGSCLQIFKAMDNLVSPRAAAKKPAEAAPAKSATKPATRPEMPSFEYKKPAAARTEQASRATEPAKPAAPAADIGHRDAPSKSAIAHKDDEEWEYGFGETGMGGDDGQENMLRFDQAAIDTSDDEADDGAFADDQLISDEMPLDDDDEPRSSLGFGDDLSKSFLELDGHKPAEKSLFDREIKRPKYRDNDEDQQDPDESWAIDLLDDDDEATPSSSSARQSPPPPAYRPESAGLRIDEPEAIDEPEDSTLSLAPHRDSHSDASSSTEPFTENGELALSAAEEEPELSDDYAEVYDNYRDDEYFDDSDRSELLSHIQPEPVEFALYQGRNWRKTLLWGGLATLAMLLLLGQVAWLQFDSLSRKPPYRDMYAAICPLVGCQLPSLAAPNMIRTSNLVVRSHPQAEGALMVDTILLNTAAYQQPFPDLVLSFSNIHGETLTARRFTPQEYLAGELAGRTLMPSNQPVHLSLEIVDPGADAVNYSAHIPH